jgi:hypothetical protein
VARLEQVTPVLASIRRWPAPRFALASAVALTVALVTGVPTDLIDTPLFARSIEVTEWAFPVWILSSVLIGLLVATDLRPGRATTAGGLLALFAIGCPVCNKPVYALLGPAGTAEWFAPAQPVLGGLALVLLGAALVMRLRLSAHRRAFLTAPPSRSVSGNSAARA